MSSAEAPASQNRLLCPFASLPQPLFGIISEAVEQRATDIHLDPTDDTATLRFRVDGAVHLRQIMPYDMFRRIINQLKVAAELDIDGSFVPLEGQFRWQQAGDIRDIRVTIIPTSPRRQAAHLRLLIRPENGFTTDRLGLNERELFNVHNAMRNRHGLILVAGPTGSGKTTTLYALTSLEDLKQRVAVSIEDPVEFDLPGVRQLEVDETHGITMEQGLRTLLRVDPDVLVVGEIRDKTSACIVARAALTGRLALASVHGRDAAGAIEALHYLSVPYYILGGALRLVIAQNLVRRLCHDCAIERPIKSYEAAFFQHLQLTPPPSVHDANGCQACNHYGYLGRVGVFEVAMIDEDTGLWLTEGPRQQEIRQRFLDNGVRSLAADTLEKVSLGLTSMQEVLRLFGQSFDQPLQPRRILPHDPHHPIPA